MDRDRKNSDAPPPSTIEEKALLRSIGENGGEEDDHMMHAALRPTLRDQFRASQRPVSVAGWSMAIAVGLALWAMLFYLIF